MLNQCILHNIIKHTYKRHKKSEIARCRMERLWSQPSTWGQLDYFRASINDYCYYYPLHWNKLYMHESAFVHLGWFPESYGVFLNSFQPLIMWTGYRTFVGNENMWVSCPNCARHAHGYFYHLSFAYKQFLICRICSLFPSIPLCHIPYYSNNFFLYLQAMSKVGWISKRVLRQPRLA